MECSDLPCEWHWCKTNNRCYLYAIETGTRSLPKNPDIFILNHNTPKKVVKNRKKGLKNKLTPTITGITQNQNYYTCHYCRNLFGYYSITADHKIPKSKGGTDHKDNLLPACYECNTNKADKYYSQFIQEKYTK